MADHDDDIKDTLQRALQRLEETAQRHPPVDTAELRARLQRIEQRIVELSAEIETVRREIRAQRSIVDARGREHP